MKTTKFYVISLIAILICTFSQQSVAQMPNFYNSQGWINTIATIQENQIVKNALGNTKNKNNGNSGVSKPNASNQTSPPAVPAYRRYPAVQFKSTGTRLTLQEYLDSVNISSPDKAELKELILDIFKKYETAAVAKGYPNDWALAFVSYIGINSRIYNGITEESIIPFEQNVGLRDVVAESATDKGVFNNVTDRQKQELYELLILNAGLTRYFYEKALKTNNPEELRDIKLTAARNLKIVGLKP